MLQGFIQRRGYPHVTGFHTAEGISPCYRVSYSGGDIPMLQGFIQRRGYPPCYRVSYSGGDIPMLQGFIQRRGYPPCYRVSYSGGDIPMLQGFIQRRGYPHVTGFHTAEGISPMLQGFIQRRGYPPPNLSFPPRFISTCNNISTTSLLWPQNPPEATSKGLNFKNSLGEYPHTPQEQCASHDRFFPLPNKNSYIKPCVI